MINEILNRIENKVDTVIKNQHRMDIKFTKKVGRNSLILNGMLWCIGILITAGVAYLFTLIK